MRDGFCRVVSNLRVCLLVTAPICVPSEDGACSGSCSLTAHGCYLRKHVDEQLQTSHSTRCAGDRS